MGCRTRELYLLGDLPRTWSLLPVAGVLFPLTLPFIERPYRRSEIAKNPDVRFGESGLEDWTAKLFPNKGGFFPGGLLNFLETHPLRTVLLPIGVPQNQILTGRLRFAISRQDANHRARIVASCTVSAIVAA